MASVGKHIRRIRTERHMTQEQLAEKLFVTRQAVSAWETGRAQPDVETLERIAAALEADVTEVIYGIPQSPNLRRLKRRWVLMGGIFATIIAFIFIILIQNGTWGTWRAGLQYQLGNSNYRASYAAIPGSYSVKIDLNDLESNLGKVLYEDETGCRIVVHAVDVNESKCDNYRIWFRAHGVYDRAEGTLVSGAIPYQNGSFSWIDESWPQAMVSAGGLTQNCSFAGNSGMNRKDGTDFGFHLTANNGLLMQAEHIFDHGGVVTVTVSGLTRLTTTRMWYWEQY